MKVSSTQPFKLIYSLFEHELLGYLFEPFVVQENSLGKLTLQHQTISSTNASEFKSGMDETDFQLIKLIDAIQPEAIHKKFGDKKLKTNDFFLKIFDKNKGNEELQDIIENYLEKYKAQILDLLHGKMVFEMGNDGEPTWKEITVEEQKATVLFHFYRNETNTHYLPTIKHKGERIEFKYKGAKLICLKPAWLLCEGKLYHFEKDVEGTKLKPFLNKKFIEVPRKIEEEFFKKFGLQLIAQFDVHAEGFDIKLDQSTPKAFLVYSELQKVNSTASLFDDPEVDLIDANEESKMVFELKFQYGEYSFVADNPNPTLVRHEKLENGFTFYKIKRNLDWEKQITTYLKSTDFEVINAKKVLSKADSFSWLSMYRDSLSEHGITVMQNPKDSKRYFSGASSIKIEVNENIDWFDIKAVVKFGDFEIPFYFLKGLILAKQQEFKLPNGEIAVIPKEWFTKYSELFAFMDGEKDADDHKIKKHHISLVQELQEDSLATVTMNRKLENLRNFDHIDHFPLPEGFKGELRPYQHAGYNWLHFLNEYKFGGCLADDMGLGKTVQTLAFLLSQKQNDQQNTSLLIVPTSLIYNWELEAKKFTPSLKIHLYTGTYRDKKVENFSRYDLVITSYGVARMDEEIIKKFYFHYIILDESQAIKNPTSNTSKAVRNLRSRFRLILTGTPIENTTLDLWSQMTFINPGLLGSQNFFKEEFLTPIEKKGDELKTKKLYSIIKPFILRRQKTQVAKDLPEKIESIRYSNMTEAQEKLYEETKSYFRNKILEIDTDRSGGQKQIQLLQGLTKLRQIANHPSMVDENYADGSGKMEDVFHLMKEAIDGGHKVLVFSQFVKHLNIFRAHIETQNQTYCYIDGSSSTTERQAQVEKFQSDGSVKLFLISLKAGGVGLNLTAADYVFILDPWWNPAVEAQAVDRAHRIGQKKTVFTYKFITKNSVEEKILVLQNRKKALAGELISNEEGFIKSLSKEDIEMILS